jgi:phosphatidylglycerol lysyltransferase
MSLLDRLRQLVPIAVSAAVIALAATVLLRTLHRIHVADVLRQVRGIDAAQLVIGGLLVVVMFAALATYESIIARFVNGPVTTGRAVLGALAAAPIGHAVGWGALSGGAVRYRIYSAAGMRPLDVGKMVLLAAMPYAAALGFMLAASLVLQSREAAAILHVAPAVATGTGLAILALHAVYVALVVYRREPLAFGRFMLTLPPPSLTAVQYAVGIIELCAGVAVLYLLLPAIPGVSFVAFVGIYVLCILAALASSVPAGLGVFESVLLLLLPRVPPDQLLGAMLGYRALLEVVPLLAALALLAGHELWSRLPRAT